MKLKELKELNKQKTFSDFRKQHQRELLMALTLGGAAIVVIWQFIDVFYNLSNHTGLRTLRGITLAFYLLNLIVALVRANEKAYKQHIIWGFYSGTLYCLLLAILTGGFESPYWFGLFFILIAWFVVLPYGYKELSVHGVIFMLIFIVGLSVWQLNISDVPHLVRIFFLYTGVLFVGVYAAIDRNKADALNYNSSWKIKEANEELQAANEELRAEMESHSETMQMLEQKQQFIDGILANAPIIIWSLDLEGRFTYTHGKALENLGVKPGEHIGKSVFEVYKGTDAENFVKNVMAGNIVGDIVKVGNIIYDTRVSVLTNRNGEKTGYMGVAMDITEQKNLEKQWFKFKQVLDQAPGAVLIMDKQFNFEYINPHFTQMSGYSSEELLHKNITDTLYRGTVPESRKDIATAVAEGNNWQGELLTINKSGNKYWANTIMSPFKNEKGEIDGYIVIQQDITDKKNMENALRESEDLYRTLIEKSLDGIVLTRNAEILMVNEAFCNTFGYTHDEILKVTTTDLIHPDDRERVVDMHYKRMRGEIGSTSYSARMLHKTGKTVYCEVNAATVAINGQNTSFITMRDVSTRLAMQEALRESEEKYRELVETTNSIILKWDKDFRVTFLNEYGLKYFDYKREEIIGQPVVGTIIPHSEQFSGRNLQEMVHDIFKFPEKYSQNINENMRKNGERAWISWNNTAIKDEHGNIVNMFSVGTDITERRKSEEELRITKEKLQELNLNLEKQVNEAVHKLTEANTQLIRLQKENLQSQFEVLRQQVNPHFLFNSLNVLTSLIKLEPDLAEKFTEHLSKVYRYVLENKDNDLVSLYTELDFLDAYLFLLNIRFLDKIKVEIDIKVDKNSYLILPLALQLIIENAIKHNTMSKKAPLVIQLFIDNNLMLNIVNNLQERESHMASTGVGLNNIAHRYELLELPAPVFEKTETQFVAKIPLKKKTDDF